MRYKRMGKNGDIRVHIPTLNGGLNTAVDPTLIADNELADVKNLHCKHGALQTRPALCAVGGAPVSTLGGNADYAFGDTYEYITPHPFEADGEMCVAVIDMVNFKNPDTGSALSSQRRCRVITLDGVVKNDYAVGGTASSGGINALENAVVVPCDKQRYGCDFLMYHSGRVYRPDVERGQMMQIPEDELYAPLVMRGAKSYDLSSYAADGFEPMANGVQYEGFNTLTSRYRCRFTGGGVNSVECYCLPTPISGEVTVEGVTKWGHFKETVAVGSSVYFQLHDGVGTKSFHLNVNAADHSVYIMPPLPEDTLVDNVEITATADGDAPRREIRGASIATWFGGTDDRLGGTRVFLGGFADHPSKLMWSEVNNPLYFPESNIMYVGDVSQRITALEKQERMLVIFKEREMYYTTTVQSGINKEASIGNAGEVTSVSQSHFSLIQLSPYTGCDCPHTLATCRDRLVWANADGRVYTLAAADRYSECCVCEIGDKIYARLLRDTTVEQRRLASAADYDGCYCLLIGTRMFLFDYTAVDFWRSGTNPIAWYVDCFDGFMHGAWHRIVSDGAHKALVLSVCHLFATGGIMRCEYAFVRAAYRFTDDPVDAYLKMTVTEGALSSKSEERPIDTMLVTKSFDFGEFAAFKRVKALYLAAKGQARVSFLADGREESPRFFAAFAMGVHLVMPSIKRCQTVAVRLQSDAPLIVRGLRLQCQTFGTVR